MLPKFYRITFALGGLDGTLAAKQYATLLEALVWAHVFYLRENPRTPSVTELLRTGALRFDASPQGARAEGSEDWQDIPSTLQSGSPMLANDRTLAAWRAAELRVHGNIQAKAALVSRAGSKGRTSVRAVVNRPDGYVEELAGEKGWREIGDAKHFGRVTFVLDLFNPGQRNVSHSTLQCMLDALTDIDSRYLRHHPETPLLYESGVRYEEEPPGQEDWQDIPTTLRMGVGDCDDLAPWRAAEHRALFWQNARPTFKDQKLPSGASLYHIMTLTPDRIEDPSRVCGMR